MSEAETKVDQALQRIPGGTRVVTQGDQVRVESDLQLSDDDVLSSPVAKTVRAAREDIDENEHDTIFDLLDALVDLDGELSGAVNAIAQSATYSDIVLPEDDPSDEEEKILEECRLLAERIRGREVAIDVLRNLIKYGNDISKKVYNEDDGIIALQSLPVNSVTIVEDRNNIGEGGDSIPTEFSDIFQAAAEPENLEEPEEIEEAFERDAYVLNEDESKDPPIIEPYNVLHFAIDARSHWFEDHTGRITYGVWGQSRLEALKFTIQTKYNTLTNKVAMDDKLLAREVYYIDTEKLFGDIPDRDERIAKAEDYAEDLATMLEELEADERPIVPKDVEVQVIGPEGKAIDQRPFVEQLNNGIAAALTFPMAGLGRGTTAVKAGEEISSLWAENNIQNLRRAVVVGFEELFRDHIKLKFPDLVVNRDEADNIGDWELDPEIAIPTLKYEPFKQDDRTELANQIETLVNVGVMGISEARDEWGLPTDEESMERLAEENPNFGAPSGDEGPPGEDEGPPESPDEDESEDDEGGSEDDEGAAPPQE